MSKYEFSLRQEVLMEQGASVLGDLYRMKRAQRITQQNHPVSVMYGLVWSAKQDILEAKTEPELNRIEGQFNLASRFVSELGAVAHA